MLFEPGRIGKMTVKNRFVRTAAGDGLAVVDKGECTDELIDYYRRLADGGTGMIITGATYVHPKYPVGKFIGMYSDYLVDGYKKFTKAVKAYDARIVCQLNLGGRAQFPNEFGPSPVPVELTGRPVRELSADEIEEFVDCFAQAARRCKEAGFDGVEFHAAHGYLFHSFLSPFTNRRTDKWGGSFENRMRFVLECYEKARSLVGDDYPIMIKANAQDYLEGGITLEEGKRIAAKISAVGFDAIELSAGVNTDRCYMYMAKGDLPENFRIMGKTLEETLELYKGVKNLREDIKFKEAYFRSFARDVKKDINIPLILPGGNRLVSNMEEVLQSGDADFIGLCRPLIREPDFPNNVLKWGQKKAGCMNCNRCLTTGKGPWEVNRCYQLLFRPSRFQVEPDQDVAVAAGDVEVNE
jgi:2,4-dienoyl-CoA reductase-like NADH-dependent reductase (Old Yellow Enzyme family)